MRRAIIIGIILLVLLSISVTQSSGQIFGKEADLTVINLQSYPVVGGNWTVMFNTEGVSDLTITAVNTTEFGEDIEFLELRCGDDVLKTEFTDGAVFVKDYVCNETSYLIDKVLTTGKHDLEFRFGDVVEYAHNQAFDDERGFRVFNGSFEFTSALGTSTTQNIGATVNTSNAFLVIYTAGSQTPRQPNKGAVLGYISSSNQVTFERTTAADALWVSWFVVEALNEEFTVRGRGAITLGAGVQSNTASVSGVQDVNQAIVVYGLHKGTGTANGDWEDVFANVHITDASTVTAKRDSGSTGTSATIRYEVVEWSSDYKVYTGETTVSSGEVTALISGGGSPSDSVIDMSRSLMLASWTTPVNGIRQVQNYYYISNTNEVTIGSYSTGTYNNLVRWYVIEFPGNRPANVQRFSYNWDPTTAPNNVQTNTITSEVNTSRTFIRMSCSTSGTGTAFRRDFNLPRLIDGTSWSETQYNPTTANYDQHETRASVVELPYYGMTIESPLDQTYTQPTVWFNITTSDPTDWCGYSLDGTANVTMANDTATHFYDQNTTMDDGSHNVIYYCNNTAGNMYNSSTRSFSVDTSVPGITIDSPLNQTYILPAVWFNITIDRSPDWCGYSLDGVANVTMANDTATHFYDQNTTMDDGSHNVIYYCNSTTGNMGSSNLRYFSVDTTPPVITLEQPLNQTYGTSTTWFNVSLSKSADWCGYSLDGVANVTMANDTATHYYNQNTSMTEGSHNVVYYCNNTAGNMGSSSTRYFSVDTSPPVITIDSPLNQTYGTSTTWFNVSLDDPGSWCGYSLDGAGNITMGNSSSSNWSASQHLISNGSHNVVFYCNNTVSYMNSSSTRYFSVDLPSLGAVQSPIIDTNQTQYWWYGIASNTALDSSLGTMILLNQSPSAYFSYGSFESAIFNAGSNATWNNLSCTMGGPYQQELPGNQQVETQWLSGNANMTGNVLLMHFDENDTVFIDDFSIDPITSGDYTWTKGSECGSCTYTYDSVNDEVEIRTCGSCGSGGYIDAERTVNLPSEGYMKLNFTRVSDPGGPQSRIHFWVYQDDNNYYKWQVADSAANSEGVKKVVDGVTTDVDESGNSVNSNKNYLVEFWWSPTGMRLDVDGTTIKDITTTNTTELKPVRFKFRVYRFDVDWKSVEIYNLTKMDSSGEGNHGYVGTDTPPLGFVSGKLNGSSSFDGSDDYVAIQNLNYNTAGEISEVSVCSWIKTSDTRNAFVDFDRSEYWSLGVEFMSAQTDGTISWDTTSNTGGTHDMESTIRVDDNDWHHVCGVFDSSLTYDKKIYIDGHLNTQSDAYSTGANLGTGTTRYGFIGDGSEASTFDGGRNNVYYNGTIDEVAIWNRSLSDNEILDLYNRGALKLNLTVRSCDDPVCSGDAWNETYESCPQNLSVANNTYFQYKVGFETSNSSFTPELYNVTMDYSIVCSVAIGLSTNLANGIDWDISSLPAANQSAEGNNGTGVTQYNVSIIATGCTTDLYIMADGDLSTGSDVIGLGNETYRYNTTDNTVPGTAYTSLDTTYAGNQIGSNLGDGDYVYLKYFLTVPSGQPAGNYNNTVYIKGVKSGESP